MDSTSELGESEVRVLGEYESVYSRSSVALSPIATLALLGAAIAGLSTVLSTPDPSSVAELVAWLNSPVRFLSCILLANACAICVWLGVFHVRSPSWIREATTVWDVIGFVASSVGLLLLVAVIALVVTTAGEVFWPVGVVMLAVLFVVGEGSKDFWQDLGLSSARARTVAVAVLAVIAVACLATTVIDPLSTPTGTQLTVLGVYGHVLWMFATWPIGIATAQADMVRDKEIAAGVASALGESEDGQSDRSPPAT